MRRALPTIVTVSLSIVLCAPCAIGQQSASPAQLPPPMTNLQVYPKDIPRPQLVTTMQGFVAALGVQQSGGCGYCHVGTAPQFDFASDAKREKVVARKMILMSREITAKLPDVTGKTASELTSLRCATCHRGVAIPKLLPDILTETAGKSGVPAAIEQYRALRKQYYGGQSYDFSEGALVALGNQLNTANKPEDALAFLQLNAEFYPNSAPTYAAMAQAYTRKNDKDSAIRNLEKALQLDPNNQQAKRQLEQLKSSK